MTKIKNILIRGIRGVMDSIELPLNEKSILLYGDNGAGKSSISDAMEWFYKDKIIHLASSEIDLKDAVRNSYLADDETSSISISYNKSDLDATRSIFKKDGRLMSQTSNSTGDSREYYANSKNENLILRHQFLSDFVVRAKGDKLKYLSDIIGFSEVTKTKALLKKVFNSAKTEIGSQNYEVLINTQKQTLIEKIGAAVGLESDLFERINEIIAPRGTGIIVSSLEDIDTVLEHLKKAVNAKQSKELQFLENVNDVFSTLKEETAFIDSEYQKYFAEFNIIADDVQSIMQTLLAELLESGEMVLRNKYHSEKSCPLCLQPKDTEELILEIQGRLKEIEESSKKKAIFDLSKQSVANIATERLRRIGIVTADNKTILDEYVNIKRALNGLASKITEYQKASNVKVTSGNKLPSAGTLALTEEDFQIQNVISQRIEAIQAILKADNTTELYANISAAKDAFLNIKRFEIDKSKREYQKYNLGIIYNKLVQKQKEGLENFINTFSAHINTFYQYMNPRELFQQIRIVTIGEEDELNGLTIQYKYNDTWVSPPQKYFSESHLNCFGISFFLASIVAFNQTNKFIILDDVASSFDTNHKQRFANLLFEKFSDYQIILLTHEAEWFSYIRPLAQKRNWMISEVKWTQDIGTYLEGGT